ncbi:MAG: hypothetical protein A2Z70_01340 [Chloroflexi bacterium RBG_13_48_17]|nr:MAG: hypothetical protein A2Z70_01340 [Chloroflexi bacterium RBG_13_48_17]
MPDEENEIERWNLGIVSLPPPERKEPPGPERPEPPPATGGPPEGETEPPDAPPGEVLSVLRTSEPDKFIVRTELKDDKGNPQGYHQTIMTGKQVEERGGKLPAEGSQYSQRYKGSAVMGFDTTEVGALRGASRTDRALTPEYGGEAAPEAEEAAVSGAKPRTGKEFKDKWQGSVIDGMFTGTEQDYKRYQEEFDSLYKELPDGSIMDKEALERIKKDDPALYTVLINEGYENYERAINARNFVSRQEGARQSRLVARSEAEYRSQLRNIDPTLVQLYDREGYEAVQKEFDRREQEWLAKLPEKYQAIAREKGPTAAVEAAETDIANQDKVLKLIEQYKTPEGDYNLSAFLSDQKKLVYLKPELGESPTGGAYILKSVEGPKGQLTDRAKEALLTAAGFDAEAIKPLIAESKLTIPQQAWRNITPWDESKGERATPKGAAVMAAEMYAPGVFTVKNWNELSPLERALYIAIDAASLVPLVGAAAAGARTASVTGKAAKLARLGGAARGLGVETLAQIKAPVNVILHPVGTVKTTARELGGIIETIADPRKLPESAITNIYHTLKLRVKDATTPAKAKAMTDLLVQEAARSKDKRVFIQAGDQVLEIERSPIMRETAGLASGSPMGEELLKGKSSVVTVGEDGMYFSPNPPPRFSQSTGSGLVGPDPEKGHTLIIISPKMAEKVVSSNKTYQGTAELEGILTEGTKIPIAQKLYTRVGPTGQYTELWLEKPLSARQIIKLKAEGLAETIKQPFTPAIKIETTGAKILKGQELVDSIASQYGLETKPASKASLWKRLVSERNIAGTFDPDTNKVILKSFDNPTVILHELAHDKVSRSMKSAWLRKLESVAGLPDDTFRIAPNGTILSRRGIPAAKDIANSFNELSTIEYVKQLSGYDNIPYRDSFALILDEHAITLNKLNLHDDLNRLAKKYVDSLKVSYKGQISAPKPALQGGLTQRQTNKLATVLDESGNATQARNLRRAYSVIESRRPAAPQLSRVIGRLNRAELRSARLRVRAEAGYVRPAARIARPGRVERPARISRSDRAERAARAERIERPERMDRVNRVDRVDRVDRVERPSRVERAERTERADRVDRVDRVEFPERLDRPDRPDRLDRPERPPKKPGADSNASGVSVPWTEDEVKSAIAWKDGIVVHALKAPYRRGVDEQTFSIKNVPPGLVYLDIKGKGSQEASAKVAGKLPGTLTVDVGNQDVIITPRKNNRVSLRHVRDTSGSSSKLTIKKTGHRISRKTGRVYKTQAGGGEIISRRPLRGY